MAPIGNSDADSGDRGTSNNEKIKAIKLAAATEDRPVLESEVGIIDNITSQ
tara:strand:+ start:754 stop:906 length:153 start_codon:yes stop_codon:yes gene_type:complete